MQRIIAALALSGASAFVAPVAKTSAVARASDATETAAPAKTGFTYADLKVRLRRLFHRRRDFYPAGTWGLAFA